MPSHHHSLSHIDIHTQINLLITNLISIHDTTGEFLLTLPDGRVIDTKGWHDWEWTHGIGLYGLWHYHELTNSPEPLQVIEDWFKARFDSGGTSKNINTMAVFLTLACVYEKLGRVARAQYEPWLDAWAEWAMYDLERTEEGGMQHVTYLTPNTQQLWDDTLMMTVLPLAKIGLVLNRPHYISEAKRQFLLHIHYLHDTTTSLFFHGWEFTPDSPTGSKGHNFARALWGRGNSWLTIAIPEFISLLDLPPSDPFRIHLLSILISQISALKHLQDPSTGLWRTILNHPESSGSYPETSCTAGFAFGILKSIRKKYIPAHLVPSFTAMAIKAVKGVLANINAEGELQNVSFGTPVGTEEMGGVEFYKKIPITSMPYGQAMAMMCLVEFLRCFI